MDIVTFGDSVTVGVREGVLEHETYSAQLEKRLNAEGIPARVVSRGIRGENTTAALRRLPEILDLKPDYLTVMYGLNDAAVDAGQKEPRVSLAEYSAHLETMVAQIRTARVRPVLLTINPMYSFGVTEKLYGSREPYLSNGINFLTERYAETMRQAGKKLNVPIVDIYTEFFRRAPNGDMTEFFIDGMHPNPAGHTIIAEMLAEYFMGKDGSGRSL